MGGTAERAVFDLTKQNKVVDLLIAKDKEGIMDLSIGWANFVAAMSVFWKVVGCIAVGIGALWLLFVLWRSAWRRHISYWATRVWNQARCPFRAAGFWLRRADVRLYEFFGDVGRVLRSFWETNIPRNIIYACLAVGALMGIAIGMRAFLMDLLLPEYKMRIYSSVVVGGLFFGAVAGTIVSVFSRKHLKLYERLGVLLFSPPVGGFIVAPMCIAVLFAMAMD
jgi:hypothetical protein